MDRHALRERRRSRLTEPPGAERHAGWCWTRGRLTLSVGHGDPIRLSVHFFFCFSIHTLLAIRADK